jgi:hypothetical protein
MEFAMGKSCVFTVQVKGPGDPQYRQRVVTTKPAEAGSVYQSISIGPGYTKRVLRDGRPVRIAVGKAGHDAL